MAKAEEVRKINAPGRCTNDARRHYWDGAEGTEKVDRSPEEVPGLAKHLGLEGFFVREDSAKKLRATGRDSLNALADSDAVRRQRLSTSPHVALVPIGSTRFTGSPPPKLPSHLPSPLNTTSLPLRYPHGRIKFPSSQLAHQHPDVRKDMICC